VYYTDAHADAADAHASYADASHADTTNADSTSANTGTARTDAARAHTAIAGAGPCTCTSTSTGSECAEDFAADTSHHRDRGPSLHCNRAVLDCCGNQCYLHRSQKEPR
jgi:hypothetical protein